MTIYSQPQNFGTQGFVIGIFFARLFTSTVHTVTKHPMILSFSTLTPPNQAISFINHNHITPSWTHHNHKFLNWSYLSKWLRRVTIVTWLVLLSIKTPPFKYCHIQITLTSTIQTFKPTNSPKTKPTNTTRKKIPQFFSWKQVITMTSKGCYSCFWGMAQWLAKN